MVVASTRRSLMDAGGPLHGGAVQVVVAMSAGGDMRVLSRAWWMASPSAVVRLAWPRKATFYFLAAELAGRFNAQPRVAMLSFSNFGGVRNPPVDAVREATRIVRERAPAGVISAAAIVRNRARFRGGRSGRSRRP